jgi:hypothetical protein
VSHRLPAVPNGFKYYGKWTDAEHSVSDLFAEPLGAHPTDVSIVGPLAKPQLISNSRVIAPGMVRGARWMQGRTGQPG